MKVLPFFICLLALIPGAFAQEIDFSAVSRQLLDNEMTRSPVYTKMLYRQIYEINTAAYNRKMQYLDEMKKKGKLSQRDWLAQTEALKKAYKTAHPKALEDEGRQITQAPVDMLLQTTFTENYIPLMAETHVPTTQKPEMKTSAQPQSLPASQATQTQAAKNMGIIKLNNTQKLGRKSLRINLDSFK